ncbi:MAG: histidinol dehydrogenase [Methanophagales archaeon ANME-1-THS]|nr:MAG: histidinol dehydrogenase [Methanophagales archaeon ANME-1-THS]
MRKVTVRRERIKDLRKEEWASIQAEKDLAAVMPRVREIIAGVKDRGDAALREYTERFDRVKLKELEVKPEEIEAARSSVDELTLRSIEAASRAIKRFHYRQKRRAWGEEFSEGIFLGELFVPFELVGAYVPASYFSSALMCVIPAVIAGVREIIVCTPPRTDGTIDPRTLVAAELAGATRIFKAGGAQAIAALALGTETIPKVQKIVGPGNVYVTAAKLVAREEGVEIDFPAGPSEVLIIGDETANPAFIAADMLAQAEHGEKSQAVLLTTSANLAAEVERIIIAEAGQARGAQFRILTAESLDECMEFANAYAPEHLELMVREPMDRLKRIRNAGSVFIGNYSPVAAGDYATGANHVLPTAGYAKLFTGLDVDHFMHRITIQWLDKGGLEKIRETVVRLSTAEGMERHAQSIEKRFLD